MKINSKKIVIIAVASVLVIAFVLLLLLLLRPKVDFTEKRDDIFYFPVDYSEDIFEDLVYLNRNRTVRFDRYGTAVYINEENCGMQSVEAKFFYDYIQTVINGECEKHREFFDKSFFSGHSIPEKFTKQKLYDIEIFSLTSDIKDGVAYETYKVCYKIQENNGTFRADVSSGESKPVAVTIKRGKEFKITSIIPIL